MMDLLKTKGQKAYKELMGIAEHPVLLFSNDRELVHAEAQYNLYTIQTLNKLIERNKLSVLELEKMFGFVETSLSDYLKRHYPGKRFVFYLWGDELIPAIRFSIVSHYEGMELPFGCKVNKVGNMGQVLSRYAEKAKFDGITISESNGTETWETESDDHDDALTVYCNVIPSG